MPIAGQPFTLVADHDGANTTSYEVWRTGFPMRIANVTKDAAWSGGVVSVPVPALSAGEYGLTLKAIGPGGTAPSEPLSITVVPDPPTPPTNLRVV